MALVRRATTSRESLAHEQGHKAAHRCAALFARAPQSAALAGV
jgi:hypothetical protein